MRKNLESGLIHAMDAFLKVVDSGSFTAAAMQMELTTAQVSRLVTELETRLGAKLLQRTTRHRVLTDAGTEFAERCREILGLLSEAEANASGTVSQPKGRLRVLTMASFGQHYVSPMLPDFCASYPELTVDYSTSQHFPDLAGARCRCKSCISRKRSRTLDWWRVDLAQRLWWLALPRHTWIATASRRRQPTWTATPACDWSIPQSNRNGA